MGTKEFCIWVQLGLIKMSNQISPKLETALKRVYKQGFNIYNLIHIAKKQIGQPKEWHFPEEVLLRVCEAYTRDKAEIHHSWPWFVKVLKDESALWHAQQNINANKKDYKSTFNLKDLLK